MRRWKRRLLIAALLAVLVVLAIPATVAQAARRLTNPRRAQYGVDLV